MAALCVCGLCLQRSLRLCENKASGEMIHCLDTKCETLLNLNDGHGGEGEGEGEGDGDGAAAVSSMMTQVEFLGFVH